MMLAVHHAALKRRGLTYGQLIEKLAAIGVTETEQSEQRDQPGRLYRRFFLACLTAMEAMDVRPD